MAINDPLFEYDMGFADGAMATREYIAQFVENQGLKNIADSIRANSIPGENGVKKEWPTEQARKFKLAFELGQMTERKLTRT